MFRHQLLRIITIWSALSDASYGLIHSNSWTAKLPSFFSTFKYKTSMNNTYRNATKSDVACSHNLRYKQILKDQVIGEYHMMTLRNLRDVNFAPIDVYSSTDKSIPIRFHTRWESGNMSTEFDAPTGNEGILVLNVSFTSILKEEKDESCPAKAMIVLGKKWCKWSQIFSPQANKSLPHYNKEGECVLHRSYLAQHYLNMWRNDDKDTTTMCHWKPDEVCEIKDSEGNCSEKVFSENGEGKVRKMILQRFHDNITGDHYTDVNMTIDFVHWTENFPGAFKRAFEKCLYLGEMTTLHVHFFAKADEDREPPAQFYAFLVIAFFLAVVVIIALTLVVCTCSTKSFRLELWDFWIKRNAYMKYAKDHASEIAEQAADKRMEKQEALMGGMLGDI